MVGGPGYEYGTGGTSRFDARKNQLRLVTDPDKRDEYIIQEVDELEAMIREGFDRLLTDVTASLNEIRADRNRQMDQMREDFRIQSEHTNRRIAAIQATLIGAMASTTVAAIVGVINLL